MKLTQLGSGTHQPAVAKACGTACTSREDALQGPFRLPSPQSQAELLESAGLLLGSIHGALKAMAGSPLKRAASSGGAGNIPACRSSGRSRARVRHVRPVTRLDGRRLFLEETFGGNGRTCATCHPPTNNFTIDPAFIRTLRGNDPLFVKAPSEPDLKELEVKRLLQRFGLVLENVDGLDQPGVLRGVPHTLGLSQSISSDRRASQTPPAGRVTDHPATARSGALRWGP